jgi:GT2 family glycosyltransferase
MNKNVDCRPGARLLEWSGSGALRWNVSGFGCDRPFTVEIDRPEQIQSGISIANEELRAINSAIRRRKIPNPVTPCQPDLKIEAEGPFCAFANSFDFAKHNSGHNNTLNLLKKIDFSVRQRAKCESLNETLGNLSKRVGHGRIVVVAETFLYDVLQKWVRDNPRFVVLRAGYGSSGKASVAFLRKPSQDSVLHWLCADAQNEEQVGAVALVGSGSFEPDIQAIRDSLNVHIFRIVPTTAPDYWRTDRLVPANSHSDLPKISIVTVSFNQAAFLERTIESVLTQEYPNLEYVIVDGGSTDGSVRIIDRYREHFNSIVIEPDNGQSDALNKGFRLTSGEVMNWLCSDDLLEPNSLYRVAQTYLNHKPDVIVGGCVRIGGVREIELARHHTSLVFGETIPLDPFDMLRFMRSWQRGHYFFQPEVFFSRRIWDAAGSFIKPHLYYAMDYDLWLRMAFAGAKVHHIPSLLGCSRVHVAQKTQGNQHYLPQVAEILHEYKVLLEHLLSTLSPKRIG